MKNAKHPPTKQPEFWIAPDEKGSLGLLALGAKGVALWRNAKLKNKAHADQAE